MSQPSSTTSSGFTWAGFFTLVVLGFVVLGIGVCLAGSPERIPGSVLVSHHHHHHDHSCGCKDCTTPTPCCETCHKTPCCCKAVCYPPEPTFTGRVDGGSGRVDRRCFGSIELRGPSSAVTATGSESVMNAQLLHEHALNLSHREQANIDGVMERSYAPPKVVTKTVTRNVYVPVLTAPVPSVTIIPNYTVVGPTTVLDGFGRRWYYGGYGWRLNY